MGKNRLDYLEEERIKLWKAVEPLRPLKDDVLKIQSAVDELRDAVEKKHQIMKQTRKIAQQRLIPAKSFPSKPLLVSKKRS